MARRCPSAGRESSGPSRPGRSPPSPQDERRRAPVALQRDAAQALLRDRYDGTVAFVTSTAERWSPDDQYLAGWRFNDSPWFGGDRIAEGCTTGYQRMQMLTAAHCGGTGTVFHNGPRTTSTFSTMGTVSYWNDSTDISVIGVASSVNSINVGPAENSSVRSVSGWDHPVVGQYLCQSGS